MKILAIVLSESAAKKLSTNSVVEIKFKLNNNDILLNLYGDSINYKAFPDLGESIKGNILLGYRRLIKNTMFYDMSDVNLSRTFETDTVLYENGVIDDIEIYSNEPIEDLEKYKHNTQIVKYLKQSNDYHSEIVSILDKYIDLDNRNYSDEVAYLYKRSKSIIDPNSRWKDDNVDFENLIVKIKISRLEPVVIGSKLSNRL